MMNSEVNYDIRSLEILVVDDNKHMGVIIKTILNALGVRNVVCATDGAEALKELKIFNPDIIITDWEMNPLDGLDFVRFVRTGEDSADPYVPIIMLTEHTESRRVKEAQDVGVNEFLAKPISAMSLYSRIQAIIERPRCFVKTRMYAGPDRRR